MHLEFPYYGYRRLAEHFSRQGQPVNAKRIRRVMRLFDLKPIRFRKAFSRLSGPSKNSLVFPNLLKGRKVTGLNQVWVADLTYIRIATGYVYLAAIMDLYSRKVIGWAISRCLDQQVCLEALRMALRARRSRRGCIHHSDRGTQYASYGYVGLLKRAGMRVSMSRPANPGDNAYVESFFKTLKYEEVYLGAYETFQDVVNRVPNFIEDAYNKKRLHSGIGYCTPEEIERKRRRPRRQLIL